MNIFLTRDLYVEIDDRGYIADPSTVSDGAMGVVVKLKSHRGNRAVAWKIPRLLSDSNRGNAFITETLSIQESVVKRISVAIGLMGESGYPNPFTEGIFVFPGDDPDAEERKATLLVSFEKGKTPRLAYVLRTDQGFDMPAFVRSELESQPWADIIRASRMGGVLRPAFVATGAISGALPVPLSLASASMQERTLTGWYLGLPSLFFPWAAGTLQEAISRDLRKRWTLGDQFGFGKLMLSGLSALHKEAQLHGDLRPANVMFIQEAKNAAEYVITDYGGFSSNSAPPGQGGDSATAGATQLRQIVNSRVSPFYAPERLSGYEHEEGDAALVVRLDGTIAIAVGWKGEIFGNETVVQKLVEFAKDPRGSTETGARSTETIGSGTETSDGPVARLRQGDRIRLREFVFEIASVGADSSAMTLFTCKQQVWKVFNDHLVAECQFWADEVTTKDVRLADATLKVAELPVPRIVEIYQWSQATDLFSVGSILLYSCFPHGQTGKQTFGDLLEVLSSRSYLRTVWPRLEEARENLDEAWKKFVDAKDLTADQVAEWRLDRSKEPLRTLVLQVVAVITQTAPAARKLYELQFNSNLAEFVLFIHFVMACLHRQSDISNTAGAEMAFPFFKHRAHNDANVTNRAAERIELLRRYSERKLFASCIPNERETVPDYKAATEEMIRLENAKLGDENTKMRDENSKMGHKNTALGEENNAMRREVEGLRKTIHVQRDALVKTSADLEGSPMAYRWLMRNTRSRLEEAKRVSSELPGGGAVTAAPGTRAHDIANVRSE